MALLGDSIGLEKTTFIYCLKDPFTEQIRYIGKADNIEHRYKRHLSEKSKNHKCNWIRFLIKKSEVPIIEVIDEVPKAEWQFWERHYISLYRSWGFNLLNATHGGDGFFLGLTQKKQRKKLKPKEHCR